jgi:uncharacterized protein YuzE
MLINHDSKGDVLYFKLGSGPVKESEEIVEGIVVDYNQDGEICGIEIISFSKQNYNLNELIKLNADELFSKVVAA